MSTLYPCSQCSLETFCSSDTSFKAAVKERHLNKKEILHRASDKFSSFYVIKQGGLKTYEIDSNGHELIQSFYLKNEVYGYEAIYTGHYLFWAITLSETIVCEIPYQQFLELLHAKPALLDRTLYLISQQITAGTYLKFTTAQQKLAAFILDLAARLWSQHYMLPMTYQDIGSYLGLATETVSRIFSSFQRKKMIHIDKKYVYFLNIEKLRQIASGFE